MSAWPVGFQSTPHHVAFCCLVRQGRPYAALTPQLPNITALCEKHGVAHLELFGSAAGAQVNSDTSDFDFLVALDPNAPETRAKRWIALRAIDLAPPDHSWLRLS